MKTFTIQRDLLYVIKTELREPKRLRALLLEHPEVAFVSFFAVDIAGNDIDEKIPILLFLEKMEHFLSGNVQTDGSSVNLPGIAMIHDAKVDLIADTDVNWYIDYNFENLDPISGRATGTLRIPSFLEHEGRRVCSRSALARAEKYLNRRFHEFACTHPEVFRAMSVEPAQLDSVVLTAATELEFWVRTPDDIVSREALSSSQMLKEQYWKRTKAVVRTALEQSLIMMELYGFQPEMGHKEVGGVKAHLGGNGEMDHILEQLEIDWKYSEGLQAADNELSIRILIKEIFRLHGLEASFLAKPLDDVAGSGEHTHVNISAKLKDGRQVNLFAAPDSQADFLSQIGWASLMGLCRHYKELQAPFITASIDAFRRLRPGFEAPTHVTVSLGRDDLMPTRNRTVLLGLVRQQNQPQATRFELRSPHPHSNCYFLLAAVSQSMLDGIEHALAEGRQAAELRLEFCKKAGEEARYLREDYAYRCEEDLFNFFHEEDRDRLYGRPAATVYETLRDLVCSEHLDILYRGEVFTEILIHSYIRAMLESWEHELSKRSLLDALEAVRQIRYLGAETAWDESRWREINQLRNRLAKISEEGPSDFERLRQALATKNFRLASRLQQEITRDIELLQSLYRNYCRNLLDIQSGKNIQN